MADEGKQRAWFNIPSLLLGFIVHFYYIYVGKVVHAVAVQRPPEEKTIRARESQRNCAEFR